MRYAAISLLVVLLGASAMLVYWVRSQSHAPTPIPFDAEAWARGVADDGVSPRLAMWPDLVHTHVRRGMLRSELEAVLGAPDAVDMQADVPYAVWALGWQPVIAERGSLVVFFDESQRVVAVNAPHWGSSVPMPDGR